MDGSTDGPAIDFLLALGRVLHRYGTPADRLEEALAVVARRLGLPVEVFSTPTTLIVSFGEPAELRTRMMRVEAGELNLAKLAQADALANEVIAHRIEIDEGRHRLDAIVAAPPTYDRVTTTITHAVAPGAVAVFFGGGWADVAAGATIGLGLGLLAQIAKRSTTQARVFELIGAAFAAFVAIGATAIAPVTASLVTIAALIVLLPGSALVVAMTELATRNLISGTARLMSAVVVLLELAVGVAVGDRLGHAVFGLTVYAPSALPEWTQWAAVLAAALAMTVIVQAERRAIGWIVAAAFTGFVGTRYGTAWLGGELGVLVGALALGVLANLYARILDRPAQVILIPAIFLLVPGSMGFRGMASLLARDTIAGIDTVFAMFVVAIAIAGGLLVANAILSPRRVL